MGEETAFKNCRISDFQGLVTLTLDRVILHTIMHHSSTTTKLLKSKKLFVDGRTDVHLRPTLIGQLGGDNLRRSKSTNHDSRAGIVSTELSVCCHFITCHVLKEVVGIEGTTHHQLVIAHHISKHM